MGNILESSASRFFRGVRRTSTVYYFNSCVFACRVVDLDRMGACYFLIEIGCFFSFYANKKVAFSLNLLNNTNPIEMPWMNWG